MESRRARPHRAADTVRKKPVQSDWLRTVPVLVAFRGVDGAIYHTRCRRRIEFQGCLGGEELDFYCLNCFEHVTLTVECLEGLLLNEHVPGPGSASEVVAAPP